MILIFWGKKKQDHFLSKISNRLWATDGRWCWNTVSSTEPNWDMALNFCWFFYEIVSWNTISGKKWHGRCDVSFIIEPNFLVWILTDFFWKIRIFRRGSLINQSNLSSINLQQSIFNFVTKEEHLWWQSGWEALFCVQKTPFFLKKKLLLNCEISCMLWIIAISEMDILRTGGKN